jgi:mediator of RNA polymerase II transcription subunit 12
LKGLIASYPESMISSTVWTQHRSVLETLSLGDSRLALLFSSIDQRNRRLATLGIGREPDSRKSLIRILDLTLTNPFTSELLEQCWLLDEDKNMLIQAVLEWATSFHRPGTAKIYTAARLLRHWSKSGVDVTLAILGFLDSKFEIGRSKPAFYHLVSELVRSEHFSIPIYIQWMIARGGLSEAEDVAPDGPSATRLLVELPTHNLTESMSALRDTLLSRAGYSIRNEGAQIRACMVFLNTLLPNMQANMDLELDSDIAMTESPMDMLPTLSRGKKSEIGLWLRQKVGLQMLQPPIPPLDDWDDSPIKGGTSAITIKDFNILRQTLELMDDHSILADLLRMVSSSSDADVLALCADTVNLHLDSFSAIGALKSLFETLMTRLRCLTDDESFPRILLVSLSDLAHRVPGQKDVARQLIQELLRSDRKTAAEACSPASDHMTGVAQTAESDFTDEIERVLASGNSMDQATLERLFHRIAIHSESAWEKSPELYRNYIMLFTRLRTFDTSQFDILMAGWVKRLLRMETRPSMVQVFGPLISFGCVALRDVISSCASIAETEPTLSEPVLARLSEEVLVLLMGPSKVPHAMAEVDTYRLRIQQSHMQRDYPSETLGVVRQIVKNTLSLNGSKMQHSRPEVQDLLDSHEMLEIFQRLVLTDANSVIQKLVVPLHESANFGSVGAISRMIDKLLTGKKDVEADQRIPFELVLNLANDFTLPFCQVKLALMFISDQATAMAIDEQNSERLQEFDHAIESAIAAENTTWTCIVPSLDVSVAQHLRKRAESQFISIFQSLKTTSVDDMSTMHTRIKEATSLLYIVDATAYTLQTSPATSSLASEIIAVLNNMWLVLCTTQTQNSGVKEATMTKWLPLLLAFVTIQASAFDISRSGLENRSRLLLALTAILLELQAVDTSTEALNTVIEQAFDLALYLVDVLPDDLRHHCVRSLRDTISNRRVSYVFSVVKNPSEWLLLSQRDKAGMSGLVEGRGFGIEKEKLTAYPLRRWEMLGEPTPNVGENDTSLSLTLFGARRG